MSGTILVTGATGNIGRAAVEALSGQQTGLRLSSRSREKLEQLRATGHDAVEIDFADPATIDGALDGVEVLLLLSAQHPQQSDLQGNVVSAAARAGVRHIVKVSGGSAVTGKDTASFVGRSHWEIEQHIAGSGVAHTFLRPNYLMQNLLNLAGPIAAGKLPLPLGDARMAIVDAADVGAVAAAILADPDPHAGKTYDLTGPEALAFGDVAQRLTNALGTPVVHVSPPVDAAVDALKANGAPDWLQQHFREIMGIFASDPSVGEVTAVVEHVTGRPATSVDDFIARHAAAFA
jgi:NAD(P)H dehydrogenase (quinone)